MLWIRWQKGLNDSVTYIKLFIVLKGAKLLLPVNWRTRTLLVSRHISEVRKVTRNDSHSPQSDSHRKLRSQRPAWFRADIKACSVAISSLYPTSTYPSERKLRRVCLHTIQCPCGNFGIVSETQEKTLGACWLLREWFEIKYCSNECFSRWKCAHLVNSIVWTEISKENVLGGCCHSSAVWNLN